MKKPLYLLFILLCAVPLTSGPKLTINITNIDIQKSGKNTYTVNCLVTIDETLMKIINGNKVPYIADQYLIESTILNAKITEYDFLNANLNIDLNNDGDTSDIFYIKKYKDTYYINKIPLHFISLIKPYNDFTLYKYMNKKNEIYSLSLAPGGTPLLIYNYNPQNYKIRLGLNRNNKITIQQLPNPGLKCSIITPVETIHSVPAVTFKNRDTQKQFYHNKIFEEQEGAWNCTAWTVQHLTKTQTKCTFTVQNITTPFAVNLQVNTSLGSGTRMVKHYPLIKIYK